MPPSDEVTEVNAVSKLIMSQRNSYVTVTPAFDSDTAACTSYHTRDRGLMSRDSTDNDHVGGSSRQDDYDEFIISNGHNAHKELFFRTMSNSSLA